MAFPAYSQHWQKIGDPPSDRSLHHGEPRVPYFIDTLNGFVFDSRFTYKPNLQRTTDGGTSWSQIHFFDSLGLIISQMCFVSRRKGYVATFATPSSMGIYETKDFGDSWNRISPNGMGFEGVYATTSIVIGSESSLGGRMMISRNDGILWDSITQIDGKPTRGEPYFQLTAGNRDSLVATVWFRSTHPVSPMSAFDSLHNRYLVYSTNSGKSWQSKFLDSSVGNSNLFIPPHSCEIIREDIDTFDLDNDTYSFVSAYPDYTSWNPILQHRETGAWIAGNSCAMYLSDASDGRDFDHPTPMLFRSTNAGGSWQTLPRQNGGAPDFEEIDDEDYQNISVVGHGAVVYVDSFSFFGNTLVTSLWKTTDGGDGSLSASMLAPQFALAHSLFASGTDTLAIDECSQSILQVYNQNIGCSYGKFDSISIVGIDPTEYSVTSTHHCACQPMPDTSFILIQPKTIGKRDIAIHYHFTDDEYYQIDSSIRITLVVNSGNTPIPLTFSLSPTTITARPGDTINIPIYLSGNASLGSTSITLPFELDTNVLLPIEFKPAVSMITTGTLTFLNGIETIPILATSLTMNGNILIGTLRCMVYLGDTLATSVTLSNVSLNSTTSSCLSLSYIRDSVNIVVTGCGTSTLQQFMKSGTLPFEINNIVPNPFSNSTTIKISSVIKSVTQVSIHNLLGSEVARLFTGTLDGGEHSFTWDAHDMPEGMYVCVVQMNGATEHVPMIVVR